jgi:hypothetical protein
MALVIVDHAGANTGRHGIGLIELLVELLGLNRLLVGDLHDRGLDLFRDVADRRPE